MKIHTVLLLAVLIAGCAAAKRAETGVPTITPNETFGKLGNDSGYVFLDVRTPAEFRGPTGHLKGAVLIPVDTLEHELGSLEQYRSKTIVTYCRSGVRSARAQRILAQHGFRALSMEGGIIRWNSESLPIVKEQQQ